MTSALLGSSSVKLIGVPVTDIAIVPTDDVSDLPEVAAVSTVAINDLDPAPTPIDGHNLTENDLIILKDQGPTGTVGIRNGLYRVASRRGAGAGGGGGNTPRLVLLKESVEGEQFFKAANGSVNANKAFQVSSRGDKVGAISHPLGTAQRDRRRGANKFLEEQVALADARFAKIYGATYEGQYFELHRPTLFIVHGGGKDFSDTGPGAIAPRAPDTSGVAATDVFLSRDLKYWEYDKADFTVRMDVSAGMIEEVLLGFELDGGDDPMDGGSVGGGRVGGGRVGGGRVGGGRVGGGRVGGGRVGGGRVGGGRVGGG